MSLNKSIYISNPSNNGWFIDKYGKKVVLNESFIELKNYSEKEFVNFEYDKTMRICFFNSSKKQKYEIVDTVLYSCDQDVKDNDFFIMNDNLSSNQWTIRNREDLIYISDNTDADLKLFPADVDEDILTYGRVNLFQIKKKFNKPDFKQIYDVCMRKVDFELCDKSNVKLELKEKFILFKSKKIGNKYTTNYYHLYNSKISIIYPKFAIGMNSHYIPEGNYNIEHVIIPNYGSVEVYPTNQILINSNDKFKLKINKRKVIDRDNIYTHFDVLNESEEKQQFVIEDKFGTQKRYDCIPSQTLRIFNISTQDYRYYYTSRDTKIKYFTTNKRIEE